MLSGVLGNVPALDFGGRYGLSVSVKMRSAFNAARSEERRVGKEC